MILSPLSLGVPARTPLLPALPLFVVVLAAASRGLRDEGRAVFAGTPKPRPAHEKV